MGGWPVYTDEEIDAVADVLRSGKANAWTGPDVFAFEADYCDYTGAAHAIAMANGVEYVGFPNANNLSHAQRMQARGVQVAPVRIDGCRLLPLCQWKENPHVCYTRQTRLSQSRYTNTNNKQTDGGRHGARLAAAPLRLQRQS